MPYRLTVLPLLTLVAVLLPAAPAAAQQKRDFSGGFFAEVIDFDFDDPIYYVRFAGAGGSFELGDFEVLHGQYTFDGSTFLITDGFMVFNTVEGEIWIAFEGQGVFTGFFGGMMYILGGTGTYKNATGYAEIAAQFAQREFIRGDAVFNFVGQIIY